MVVSNYTEIQKIPGKFKLPDTWPKVDLEANATNGIVYDWHADDLEVGKPVTAWKDRISAKNLVVDTSFEAPTVIADSAIGHNALVFNGLCRMSNWWQILGDLSISVVYKADSDNFGGSRILSGSPGYRLWSPVTAGGLTINVADQPSSPLGQMVMTTTRAKTAWQAGVVRYRPEVDMYGRLSGGGAFESPISGPMVSERFVVGYNTSNAPAATAPNASGFKGQISRITIWDRALANTDIELALVEREREFNF